MVLGKRKLMVKNLYGNQEYLEYYQNVERLELIVFASKYTWWDEQ